MANFLGQLNQNEIQSALFNMIISQDVFDRIGDSGELVDKAKVDGTLYGDTKLFYAADVLSSSAWGNDAEAANLLALDRPAAPECQAIVLNKFRQIRLTTDEYLSKRAWADEGSFHAYQSLMEGMIGKTKRIYDVTLYNAFVGTAKGVDKAGNEQKVTVTLPSNVANEDEAKEIARAIADLMVEMKTVSRKFNKYGHITKFSEAEIKIVWNSKYVNKIKKIDLPTIFHKEGLMDKFEEDVLPDIYFGTPNAAKVLAANNDGTYRSMVEKVYGSGSSAVHVFPGELIPASVDIEAGEGYAPDATCIAKVLVKYPAYMSAFEVGTSFFNPRSLTTNRFLTFGHNSLELFDAYPYVSVYEAKTGDAVSTPVNVVNPTTSPVNTKEVE